MWRVSAAPVTNARAPLVAYLGNAASTPYTSSMWSTFRKCTGCAASGTARSIAPPAISADAGDMAPSCGIAAALEVSTTPTCRSLMATQGRCKYLKHRSSGRHVTGSTACACFEVYIPRTVTAQLVSSLGQASARILSRSEEPGHVLKQPRACLVGNRALPGKKPGKNALCAGPIRMQHRIFPRQSANRVRVDAAVRPSLRRIAGDVPFVPQHLNVRTGRRA